MRIRNMELMYPAAGVKAEDTYIFTEFTFLKLSDIYKLLSKGLKVNSTEHVSIFNEISTLLQDWPRFFASL